MLVVRDGIDLERVQHCACAYHRSNTRRSSRIDCDSNFHRGPSANHRIDANYSGSASATLVIAKATPVITWTNPAEITYGTVLGATQLNATADVDGSFVYSPAADTKLNAGHTQTLHVTFTPAEIVIASLAMAYVTSATNPESSRKSNQR